MTIYHYLCYEKVEFKDMWGEIAINKNFILALGNSEKNIENSKKLVKSFAGDFSLANHEGLDD